MTSVRVQLVGGPTTLIEIGGVRLLVDPTFDPPGDHPIGSRALRKTRGPAVPAGEIGAVDAVLLSHDQHPDNLDDAGRAFLADAPLTLTTGAAAERLGGTAQELPNWRHVTLPRPGGGELRIVGVPAQHGPDGTEHLVGPVTGFVLDGDGLPTMYVSGDNASLAIVQAVVDHLGPIDLAVLFAGAARTPLLDAYLTLTNDQAARAAAILRPARIIPVHTEGWAHFTADRAGLPAAFETHDVSDQLLFLAPGESTTL
ncbi:MAG TPA: MBL fold metallo-hydrolase [Mycobacteriales bacterium]|jgi:L-ascorbate metabolism protein UlaG (beta-lactamase superfamily)|nr:MBL fold metallo-hydrolase [Mycobacteriales bacterium]